EVAVREILDAYFYLLRGGVSWRMLPHDFPAWQTVYCQVRRWKLDGVWQTLLDRLRDEVRLADGRPTQPSAAALDSQSVKSPDHPGIRGFDAGKKNYAGNPDWMSLASNSRRNPSGSLRKRLRWVRRCRLSSNSARSRAHSARSAPARSSAVKVRSRLAAAATSRACPRNTSDGDPDLPPLALRSWWRCEPNSSSTALFVRGTSATS